MFFGLAIQDSACPERKERGFLVVFWLLIEELEGLEDFNGGFDRMGGGKAKSLQSKTLLYALMGKGTSRETKMVCFGQGFSIYFMCKINPVINELSF